jgi:hypothetical protein
MTVDGSPLVVIATFNVDKVNPAGAVAYRITGAPRAPRLKEAWRVPNPASPEARKWFRAPPTRPVITNFRGEPVVWLADNAANGHLLAIRPRDGKILANIKTAGWPMRNSRPVIFNDVIYLPSAVQGRQRFTWIEAYRITTPP